MKSKREYKEEIELRYGKPLKEVMHELIVEKFMDQWDGAKELGVPTDLFVSWRTQFRLGPLQRSADMAERRHIETINEYRKELIGVDLERDFIYKGEVSIRGFKELIERMVELEKQRGVLLNTSSYSNISMMFQTRLLEEMIIYLNKYENEELHKKYEFDLEIIKSFMNDK